MATLNEIYPSYYNVLATPVSNFNQLSDAAEEVKKAWEQFQKTGAFSLEALKQGFSAAQGGEFNYLTLLQAGISLAGSVVPGGSFVAPILNMVLGWLWPNNKKESDTQKLIALIDEEVKKELNKALLQKDKDDWTAYLQSIFEIANQVNNSLIDAQWSGTADSPNRTPEPPSVSDYTSVTNEFLASDKAIITNQNQIMDGSFNVPASSYFVIGATVRLSLYQSYIKFGNQWIESTFKNNPTEKATQLDKLTRAKQYMRTIIHDYTQKIMKVFKDNLPKLDQTKFGINAYNVYVKGMTLNALDMVAMWPSLYPDDYNSQTTLEQTRVIFSNMVGQEQGTDGTVKIYNTFDDRSSYKHGQITNNNVNLISYFPDELQNIQIGEYRPSNTNYGYPYGFILNYKNSKYKYGNTDPDITGHLDTYNPPLQQINAATQHSPYVDGEKINNYTGGTLPGYCTTGCSEVEKPFSCTSTANAYKESCNSVYSTQKINALYAFTQTGVQGDQNKLGVMASHVPYDLNPINIIGEVDSDTNNIILKGMPAEKGTLDNNTRPSLVKEWMNGANAVKLSSNQVLKMNITNVTANKYQIRVRYATAGDVSASISLQVIAPNNKDLTNEKHSFAAPSDKQVSVQGENGTYILNTVIDSIDLPTGQHTIRIGNTSSQDLFLDRIEFAPIVSSAPTPTDSINSPFLLGASGKQTIWKNNSNTLATDVDINVTMNLPYTGNSVSVNFYRGGYSKYSVIIDLSPKHIVNIKEHISQGFDEIVVTNTKNATFSGNVVGKVLLGNQVSFSSQEDLNKITEQVQNLFTSSSHTELASTVTDYTIDQIAMKVDALSDEVFGIEKTALRKLVNKAKQLSKARNVLVGGNFENLDEWFLGRNVIRKSGNDLFKGDHLFLPPAALYPSYAYQKVAESKLKPYTRYTVSGFVAQSEHLELVVSRYGKEIETVLNVSYGEALPITSGPNPTCCVPASCQCLSCNGSEPDSHFFSYNIDVGALHPELNPGIEFGLRIVKSNGLASVSNMEIREDRQLTEKEIKKVQGKEQKWKKAFDKERAEISATLQPVVDQINAFYKNEDWNSTILPSVTYQDLYNVVLPELPKLKHWFMEDREGEHYGILQRFKQAVERVFTQLEERNLIHNGSFANGLSDWLVDGVVQITNLGNDNLALQLSDWDASASQSFDISDFDENKQYKLRVYAKGKGTITIENDEEIDNMSFDTDTFISREQTFYFDNPSFVLHMQSEGTEFVVDSVELIELSDEDTNE